MSAAACFRANVLPQVEQQAAVGGRMGGAGSAALLQISARLSSAHTHLNQAPLQACQSGPRAPSQQLKRFIDSVAQVLVSTWHGRRSTTAAGAVCFPTVNEVTDTRTHAVI